MRNPQEGKHGITILVSYSTSRFIIQKKLKAGTQTDTCIPVFIIAKGGDNPTVYQQVNGYTKCSIYI